MSSKKAYLEGFPSIHNNSNVSKKSRVCEMRGFFLWEKGKRVKREKVDEK